MIHIVLYQPEIPQNTGNIIRTAMATGSVLHLIKPYGFVLDEKHLHRASMDYIDLTTIIEHDCWNDFISTVNKDDAIFYLTRYGKHLPDEFSYKEVVGDIYLVFDKESTGIAKNILKQNLQHCIRLPMRENARSLNLNNRVTKTIISTNLSIEKIFGVYEERIGSRIAGFYDIYYFFGEDLRLKKNI